MIVGAITNSLYKYDHLLSYIPFVSTVTNLFDLYQKYVVLPNLQLDALCKHKHYYQHLQKKPTLRCVVLLLPILGNIIIGIYDFVKIKKLPGQDIIIGGHSEIKKPVIPLAPKDSRQTTGQQSAPENSSDAKTEVKSASRLNQVNPIPVTIDTLKQEIATQNTSSIPINSVALVAAVPQPVIDPQVIHKENILKFCEDLTTLPEAIYYCKKIAKNDDELIKKLRELAPDHFGKISYCLGEHFLLGRENFVKDPIKAKELFKEAADIFNEKAEENDPESIYHLGICYEFGRGVEQQDEVKAAKKYKIAADLGFVEATVRFAQCQERGKGVRTDMLAAQEGYLAAIKLGSAHAAGCLGLLYYSYDKKEYKKTGIEWLVKGAEKEDRFTLYQLAICSYEGSIVTPQDLKTSLDYLNKAVEKKYSLAFSKLGEFYESGVVVKKNCEEAIKLYEKAITYEDFHGHFCLARCYEKGIGIAKNESESSKHYKIAADNGHEKAMFALADILKKGNKEDRVKALRYYQFCCSRGNLDASFQVALCYYEGLGVSRDKEKGIKLMTKAYESGHRGAWQKLYDLGRL